MSDTTNPIIMGLLFVLRCLIPLGILFGISYMLRRLELVIEHADEEAEHEDEEVSATDSPDKEDEPSAADSPDGELENAEENPAAESDPNTDQKSADAQKKKEA